MHFLLVVVKIYGAVAGVRVLDVEYSATFYSCVLCGRWLIADVPLNGTVEVTILQENRHYVYVLAPDVAIGELDYGGKRQSCVDFFCYGCSVDRVWGCSGSRVRSTVNGSRNAEQHN